MARSGIYKSEVVRARNKLLSTGVYPSIDAVRVELGNTGSKATIHRFLKEIEEEEGGTTGTRVSVSEAIQDLVGRLAARLNEEADARGLEIQARNAAEIAQLQAALVALKSENQAQRQSLQRTELALADEQAAHGKTSATLGHRTLEATQLTAQVNGLQERLSSEEGHRQSLEEKHQHARQALEHFRQAAKEQREQEQRKHEQQEQYLQAELRKTNDALSAKQQELMKVTQEGSRLVGDLSRAQADLHQAQEELRKLRPLKDALDFEQRRTLELGQQMVIQEAAQQQLDAVHQQLLLKRDTLVEANQRLEVDLASVKASLAAQELVTSHMLQRLSATLPDGERGRAPTGSAETSEHARP
jgi:chromosome segregation ATPase